MYRKKHSEIKSKLIKMENKTFSVEDLENTGEEP